MAGTKKTQQDSDSTLPEWMQPYRGAGNGMKASKKKERPALPPPHPFAIGQRVHVKPLGCEGIVYAYSPCPVGLMVQLLTPHDEHHPVQYSNKYHPEANGGKGAYVWEPDAYATVRMHAGLFAPDDLT